MSWSPRVISTRPPVRRSSLLSTGFMMGSYDSASWMSSGLPNLSALSKSLWNASSRKLHACNTTLQPLQQAKWLNLTTTLLNQYVQAESALQGNNYLVLEIFLSRNSFIRNVVACPEGSIISGMRLTRRSMMAFSTQRSSDGREFCCQRMRSSPLDRYCAHRGQDQ